ncbi:MAG TPA: DUF4856 domain-containing protein [Bacteroidia bacterium]|nr:DUF4856 domain-containing protein [Bacteroidia bacterium]
MIPTLDIKKIAKLSACIALVSVFAVSCKKKDKDEDPIDEPVTYSVPTTYDFGTIDTIAPKQAIAELGEFIGYIRKTHVITNAFTLDVQKLRDYYENKNNPFANTALNTGIKLKTLTDNSYALQAALDAAFVDAVTASNNANVDYDTTTAYEGHSGKLVDLTAERYVLVDANGFEYKEFVEKNIMSGVFYYQATTLLNTIGSFDNVTKLPSGLTAQQTAWDYAFAYFGVPVNFPTVKTGLKNWGNYANTVDAVIGCNTTIMNAFLKGRAAINNNDNAGRDEARNIVVKTWEKVAAAKFIAYVKIAKDNSGSQATFCHALSEGVGFIEAFKYNSAKTISDADIASLLSYFQTSGKVNLYKVTAPNLDAAISKMASIFSIDPALIP